MCPLHNQWVKGGYFSKSTICITHHMIGGYRSGYFYKVPIPTPTGCELRVHFKKYPSMCPLHNLWVNGGYFEKEPSIVPTGHFVKETLGFFHKIPNDVITKYPVGSFQRTHNKLTIQPDFTMNSQRTHQRTYWILCDHIIGYFVKETLGFFHKVASGYFAGLFLKVPTIYSKVM